MRRPLLPLVLLAAVLVLGGGVWLVGRAGAEDPAPSAEAQDRPAVRVAGGPDAESVLLSHTLVELLALEEVPAEAVVFSDARDTRQALELRDVELRIAYTGETWLQTLGRADPPGDPEESYEEVRAHDAEEGLEWFRPPFGDGSTEPPADATFAFMVAGPPSIHADLTTVSQLASRLSAEPDATLCVDPEFASRPDGLRAVLAAYSVRSDQPVLAAAPEDAVRGVSVGECIAGLTSATDGRAWRAGLRPLVDDLDVFPAFVVLPQARRQTLLERPLVGRAVAPMAEELTTELLGQMNARVAGGEPIEEVAAVAARELAMRAGREVGEAAG
ncbi:MAG: glycine betaine ABC transporter substrate-binding protein [Nitriliruptoraceae bacterium]